MSEPSPIPQRLKWLVIPIAAAAIWVVLRPSPDRSATVPAGAARPGVVAGEPSLTGGSALAGAEPPGATATVAGTAPGDRSEPGRPANSTGGGAAGAATPASTGGAHPGSSALPQPPAHSAREPERGDGSGSDALVDQTGGWGGAVVKQLNRDFMPLAAECIAQAQERNPKLEGLLVFQLNVAPTEGGKGIIESVVMRPDSQVRDPELFECMRQTSFSLDSLEAARSFDLSMPITLPDKQGSGVAH